MLGVTVHLILSMPYLTIERASAKLLFSNLLISGALHMVLHNVSKDGTGVPGWTLVDEQESRYWVCNCCYAHHQSWSDLSEDAHDTSTIIASCFRVSTKTWLVTCCHLLHKLGLYVMFYACDLSFIVKDALSRCLCPFDIMYEIYCHCYLIPLVWRIYAACTNTLSDDVQNSGINNISPRTSSNIEFRQYYY
jgi:hypothetical protein